MHKNTQYQRITESISKFNMFYKQDTVLLSCSGGPDSMYLAHFLLDYLNDGNLNLVYFNHGLRESADEDERIVTAFAEENGVTAFIESIEVTNYSKTHQISIEAAGRTLRYQALGRLTELHNINTVAMGHHMDDDIETFFMKLMRGSLYGLGGIYPVRQIDQDSHSFKVVRPLLSVKKEDILKELDQKRTYFSVDETNEETDFLRNDVRHTLLPVIEQMFPHYRQTIHSLNDYLVLFRDYLMGQVEEELGDLIREETSIKLPREKFFKMPAFLKTYVLRYMLDTLDPFCEPNSEVLNDISSSLQKQGFKTFDLPRGIRCSCDQFFVSFHHSIQEKKEFFAKISEVPIQLKFSELGIAISITIEDNDNAAQFDTPNIGFFDLDTVDINHLWLRNRISGDRFRPYGMSEFKSLQDYFVDDKIPCLDRDDVLILGTGDDIMWVVNHRIDDRNKVVETTKKLLKVECVKL